MTMTATTVQTQTLSDEQIVRYYQEGFLLARGFFSAQEVAEVRETFMKQGSDGPVPGLSDFAPGRYSGSDPLARYPRMMDPHKHLDKISGPISMRYLLDGRVERVLRDLLGEEPIAAQSMYYFKAPGSRGQALHQDNFYLRVHPGTCIAAWTAIDDADEENGTLFVSPGTNKLDVACPQEGDMQVSFTQHYVPVPAGYTQKPLNLKSGDVLFFNGNLIHGSYPNTSSDRFRQAFICHYVPASCTEMHHAYQPLYDFNQRVVERAGAIGGGPCGGDVAEVETRH
jgi:phytanoyl-CoA hydroxylase